MGDVACVYIGAHSFECMFKVIGLLIGSLNGVTVSISAARRVVFVCIEMISIARCTDQDRSKLQV